MNSFLLLDLFFSKNPIFFADFLLLAIAKKEVLPYSLLIAIFLLYDLTFFQTKGLIVLSFFIVKIINDHLKLKPKLVRLNLLFLAFYLFLTLITKHSYRALFTNFFIQKWLLMNLLAFLFLNPKRNS